MSFSDYLQAVELMRRFPERMDFVGTRAEDLIRAAEERLAIKFPNTYRRFLAEFGAGSFGSSEVLGITTPNFDAGSVPNGIWYTLDERARGLPKELVVIRETGDGSMECLDSSQRREDDEDPVVLVTPGSMHNAEQWPLIAPDFGTRWLQIVTAELQA